MNLRIANAKNADERKKLISESKLLDKRIEEEMENEKLKQQRLLEEKRNNRKGLRKLKEIEAKNNHLRRVVSVQYDQSLTTVETIPKIRLSKAISLSMNSLYFSFPGSSRSSSYVLIALIALAFLFLSLSHFTFSSLVNGPVISILPVERSILI